MLSPRVSVQIAKAVATAVVSCRDTTHLPTAALVRRVCRSTGRTNAGDPSDHRRGRAMDARISPSDARRARPDGSKLASASPPPDRDTAPAGRFSGLTLWPRVAVPLRSLMRAKDPASDPLEVPKVADP
jgi:hypothetical protein